MKKIITRIANESIKHKIKKTKVKLSERQYEKRLKNASIEFSYFLLNMFFIILGTLSAAFGLKGFLLPNSFIDGGVMGMSLIVSELTNFSLAVFIIVINLPFLIMGFSTISKQFAFKSIIAIVLLAVEVQFLDFPLITEDKLLIAVFGGFFLGMGIGLAIRGGAVIDGTEVLAVFISRKTPLTIGDVILIFNIMIFSVGAYVFSIEIALYAVLTYLAASKTVDFVVTGIEEYVGVTIISEKSEEIRIAIIEKLGRACTIYNGKRGYTKDGQNLKPIDIVYTLLTRLELSKLQTEIDKIDKQAFVIMHSIIDARGGMIKKRPMK